jgi:uronate dehydrogenase
MTVLVTGSSGAIGSALAQRLPAYGWSILGFDRDPGADIVGDIRLPADIDEALAGNAVTAVVHLAGQPTEAPWPLIRDANIDGTFQVFDAARRHGVQRVVYASSNHATGFTPVTGELQADTPARPDTLYGVSKVFGEALARYYVDRYDMQVACLRIGTFAPSPPDRRSLSTWLSPEDCARLVDACLRAPTLGYAVLWGISNNTRRTWSLDDALALGYRPQDDAEAWADRLPDDVAYPSDVLVGGGFTSPGFGIDEVTARS